MSIHVGIPREVEADPLEEKLVAIFKKLCCNISAERIEACTGSVKRAPQSLSNFCEGRTANKFGMLRENCEK